MEADELVKLIKQNKTVVVSLVQKTISALAKSSYFDEFQANEYINEIVNICFSPRRLFSSPRIVINGDSSDFHNLCVELARQDYYDKSCMVIESGLHYYPRSVNLLADYIAYGLQCGKYSKCERYYKILQAIPIADWTWRAFDFSIDYLLDRSEKTILSTSDKKKIESLINSFKKQYPNDERAFLQEAMYNQYQNNEEQEIAALEYAAKNIHLSPKCSLKLAQIYLSKGNYSASNEILDECKIQYMHPDFVNNIGEIYAQSVMCEMAIFYIELNELSDDDREKKAMKIYSDFMACNKTDIRGTKRFEDLTILIDIFSEKSGFPFSF